MNVYEWLYTCPQGHQQTVRTTFSKRLPEGTLGTEKTDIGDKVTVKTLNTAVYCPQCPKGKRPALDPLGKYLNVWPVTDFSAVTVLEPSKTLTADQEILGSKQVVKDLSGFDWQPEA